MLLTKEELARMTGALTACNGDRRKAAEMLNVPLQLVRNRIKTNKVLKAQFSTPRVGTIKNHESNGVVVLPMPAESEAQLAERTQREFELLLKDANGDADLATALSLQRAYGRYTEQCQALVGGSLVDQAMNLNRLLNKIHPELMDGVAAGALPEGFVSKSVLYTESQKMLAGIMDKINASLVVNAKVKALKEAGKGGKTRKPGFGPKNQTNVIAANVQFAGPPR